MRLNKAKLRNVGTEIIVVPLLEINYQLLQIKRHINAIIFKALPLFHPKSSPIYSFL